MPDQLTDSHYACVFARHADSVNLTVKAVFMEHADQGMNGRSGAYFVVSHRGIPIAGGLTGVVTSIEKRKKYDRLSREKCERLFQHRGAGHLLSRQSADESLERYPGAVAGRHTECGFSGYLADIDEIAAGLLALKCRDLGYREAMDVLARNPYLPLFKPYFLVESEAGSSTGL